MQVEANYYRELKEHRGHAPESPHRETDSQADRNSERSRQSEQQLETSFVCIHMFSKMALNSFSKYRFDCPEPSVRISGPAGWSSHGGGFLVLAGWGV